MGHKIGKIGVVMVGAFPPPVHGMAAVNLAVSQALTQSGVKVTIVNLAGRSLKRTIAVRLTRIPAAFAGINRFLRLKGARGETFYMSVSGGLGQVYEVLFLLLARVKGMRIFVHHHSFAYIDRFSWLTNCLCRIAGSEAIHATQSPGMAERLRRQYGTKRTIAISNAVFLLQGMPQHVSPRQKIRTLGFLSNLSTEKGVFEFLELMNLVQRRGLPLRGVLAGPFEDERTERLVRDCMVGLENVTYVGPKYGCGKMAFFDSIDAFAFPTRYANETEGIVTHEAMSRGIPVIAYGRGCIPEIVGEDCGAVIQPEQSFATCALEKLEHWIRDVSSFERASRIAAERFANTHSDSEIRWRALLRDLMGSDGHSGMTR